MSNAQVVDDIKQALKSSRKGFIAAGFFSLFINLLMLTAPLYMLHIYDRVVTSRSLETLLFLTLIMLFMFVVMGTLDWVRSRILVRIGNQIDRNLSKRVYAAMFEAGIQSPHMRSSQPLNDLTTLRQFITGNGLFAFFDVPWMPIYIGLLFVFHVSFGWFSVCAALILFFIALINERTTKAILLEASNEHVKAQALATSNLRNAEALHAMGMLPNIMQRWYQQHQMFLHKQSVASDSSGVYSNLSKTLRIVFQSLILGLGAYYVVLNEMSPGMMIAGSILMGRALAPLDLLIGSWSGFNNARAARGRLSELLESVAQHQRHMQLPDPAGRVSVENLTVRPPASLKAALQGVSFEVFPGEHIGIVGPSGSGKSTLARAMIGVWPSAGGTVRLDGAELKHYNMDQLGPHIGYLPQDIELFNGTVGENIARFEALDAEKIVEAAKKAGVHELILRLPNAYNTPIGADSGALSGGQRQRIGLARALYNRPKLIVLDEPNSNLDAAGEQALAATMQTLKNEGATVFVISHRMSILRQVDKLLVLQEGQVQAFGPRDDILQKLATP